jgi:hypothetical protein
MEFSKRAPDQRTDQTIKQKPSMKNPIRSLAFGIALIAATSMVNAQSILTYNANPTIGTNNTTFTFSMFDSNLGTLTAVQLLLNSAVPGGSVLITASAIDDGEFNSMTSTLRTSGTGLSLQVTSPALTVVFNPSLPETIAAGTNQTFSVVGSQSLISSVQTYNINSANFGSYQNVGGVGNTPNFTGRVTANFNVSGDTAPATSSDLFNSATSYTLRYTYTPSGPVPVPEPGQVAASVLLLGGIGAYYFVKRRRKSAPAAA